MSERKIPRFLIAAAASGSGKTLITCGILQALKNRGLRVASYKCGPDYIDPMFHEKVIGAKSRNLDTFFADEDTVRFLMAENSADCEISVVEGVMGYYDGLAGISEQASAYDVAVKTDTPVVFLVNGKGMSLSVIPYIRGFLEYKKDSQIRGVILNQVSPMMYPRLKEMIEAQCGIRVYGYVPVLKDCILESRHLGLVLPGEIADIRTKLSVLAKQLEKSLELDALLALADTAPRLTWEEETVLFHTNRSVRIAVARDEAFCFYYEDNLELLRKMGAELVPFSPIHDRKLPEEIDGMILNGGYPELYARALSENVTMRESIAGAIASGMPYLAECGGFMYLHEQMEGMEEERALTGTKELMGAKDIADTRDIKERYFPMVGVIKGKAYRTPKLGHFGYITLSGGCCFGQEVGSIPAHEFHYFDSENCGSDFYAKKPLSNRGWNCMHSTETGLAGFPHLYFYGNQKVPQAFLQTAQKRKVEKL